MLSIKKHKRVPGVLQSPVLQCTSALLALSLSSLSYYILTFQTLSLSLLKVNDNYPPRITGMSFTVSLKKIIHLPYDDASRTALTLPVVVSIHKSCSTDTRAFSSLSLSLSLSQLNRSSLNSVRITMTLDCFFMQVVTENNISHSLI